MDVTSLALSLIDLEDKNFLVGNKEDLSPVLSSIKEIGLINPPILRKNDKKYQIISGWKRILSCRELGFREILCKIYDTSELTDNDCLKVVFYDNRGNFSDLELAELIYLFKDSNSLDDKELIDEVLPLLGILPNIKNLDKYLSLASLDRSIKKAFYEDKITIEQCQMLSELTPDNQVPILEHLLSRYNFNNNESRQVLQIIEEISLRDSISVNEVLALAENSIDNTKKDKNELRQELRKIRYPDLTRVEEKYKETVRELKLPKQINLFVNQFFETNDLEFKIKISSHEELSVLTEYLKQRIDAGDIERLLNFIKFRSK